MSSFFTLPASHRKRKREDRASAPGTKKRGIAKSDRRTSNAHRELQERDDSISGSDPEEQGDAESAISEHEITSESDVDETAVERRLRLAEQYLENLQAEVDEAGFDAAEIDRDIIAERLKEDIVSDAL